MDNRVFYVVQTCVFINSQYDKYIAGDGIE